MKILFVCMGNICRSPLAEGHFRQLLTERAGHLGISVDSAGTYGYHVGSPPDVRAQEAARRRGIDISMLAARSVIESDFAHFDYILAMDQDNLTDLLEQADPVYHDRIRLFLDYSPDHAGTDVPDPYYGGKTGFERVLDLIEIAAAGLLAELEQAMTGKPDPR
ncbi:MAG: low molecular weight protein-tyrosine-phosphatase [Gammaproteobacteria bacterium]|jgi:protein-tyrosine phosphatase|nr:phosphotyrosine protein phosphatase [Chromatiales bacterium]MCP4925906.1 low molecular weight phosphotyrosine protein phosphatase [Gammaproteobacteria bacterium]MDP7154511.1 low molecular weight protein-tyrosine-phosphatase [Gammaproteobacteria bacterium]MDP7296935.1 low molecular weight protein-tyrosine-phosphatase [Gammaproteobacteria bacterium]MDP7419508.1 low molecular weight protein-tyrosine-phosphatase [Gammaproteobacteria bacterium]